MDTRIKTAIVTASDIWHSVIWPPYQPSTREDRSAGPLEPGQLVAPALDVAGLQTVQGFMVACDRLGPGVVRETDGTGKVQTNERADPFPGGASGWHSIVVLIS